MKCFNCSIEIPHNFTFALSQNKCPSCGKEILDEETRAIKEDIVNFVGSEISLKSDTLNKLATMLISRYEISNINGPAIQEKAPRKQETSTELVEEEVVDNGGHEEIDVEEEIEQLKQKRAKQDKAKEEAEIKEEAFKEALKEKYNLTFDEEDGIVEEESPTDFTEQELPQIMKQQMTRNVVKAAPPTNADFGDINPIIEAERLRRKVDQARAMQGGGEGSFRRASV